MGQSPPPLPLRSGSIQRPLLLQEMVTVPIWGDKQVSFIQLTVFPARSIDRTMVLAVGTDKSSSTQPPPPRVSLPKNLQAFEEALWEQITTPTLGFFSRP